MSYGCIAYYFSSKMVRLVILMGPIGSVLGAVTIVLWINWAIKQIHKLYQEGLEQGKGDTSSGDTKGSLLSNKERKRLLKKKKLANSSNLKELEEMMKPMR